MLNKTRYAHNNYYVYTVALAFVVILLMVFFLWYNNKQQNANLETILLHQEILGKKLFLSGKMAESARARTRLTAKLIDIVDPFDQDKLNSELELYATDFATYHQQYTNLMQTQQEREIFENQRQIVSIILPAQRKAVEMAIYGLESDKSEAKSILYGTVYPGQGKLIDNILELSRLAQISIENRVAEYQQLSTDIERKNLILLIIILLLGGVLAITIVVYINANHKKIIASHDNLELLVEQRTQELVNNQTELLKAKNATEEASQAKTDFLSCMSHELRTPMNAILGFAQMLEMESKDLNPSHRESVQEILGAGQHLLELINSMLDLTKIESGSLEINLVDVEVNRVIEQSVSLIEPLAKERKLEIVDNTGNNKFKVQADYLRLKQVLSQLLSNAAQYNRKYGKITIDCDKISDSRIRILIGDTGVGLQEQEIKRLFTPFERLNAFNQVGGTGIGLVIAKHMTELMGGTIGIESVVDEGTTFWVDLQLASDKV